MITFNDFKEKRKARKEDRKAYVQRVRECAGKLISHYVDSLQLPNDTWKDAAGKAYPYVFIQDLEPRTGDGNHAKPEELTVDSSAGARFVLVTITDDDPNKPQHESTRITISLVGDDLEVDIEGLHTFSPIDSDEKYSELCEFIKERILESIGGNGFGKKQPKESVNLWD